MAKFKLKYRDFTGLCELPWFEPDENGLPAVAPGVLPEIIDTHTHLAFAFMLASPPDLLRATEQALTYFPVRGNRVDLSEYSALNFNKESARKMSRALMMAAFSTSGMQETHSIPNLLTEMDRTGVSHSLVLSVEMHLLNFSDNTTHQLEALADESRLILFASVHPADPDRVAKIRHHVANGAKGLKLHPPMQLTPADDPKLWPVYEVCTELKLPILFHTGHSDLSPGWQKDYPAIYHFVPVVRDFPELKIVFGHGAIHYYKEAIELARKHDNIYFEISGQPPQRIREIINGVGDERVMFGSDWPFYPMALPLAKLLIATEGHDAERERILAGSAKKLFGIE